MKKALGLVLAVVFVLAIATPAFAQSMDWSATYDMEGDISIERQVGHFCNTGASQKQVIEGEGKMTKVSDVAQVAGKTTVSDVNDWVTAPDAIKNLTVTSVIKLCAPPKYTYEDAKVSPAFIYSVPAQPDVYRDGIWDQSVYDRADGANWDGSEWDAVSQQIWAVQVAADPGYSGNIHQQWEAAYGPYAGWMGIEYDADEEVWELDDDDTWGWDRDDWVPVIGVDFVGDYFSIEQMSRTSMGVHKRFIDISSPWSGAYVHEDMTVTGFSEVEEGFMMANLPAGEETTPAWWDLF